MPRNGGGRKRPVLEHATIEDFSDREFLLVVVDAYDDDGWADSEQVAQKMNLARRRLAASRLSWLARYGAVEREIERDENGAIRVRRSGKPFYTQRWRLTPAGEAMAMGSLRKTDQAALDRLQDGQMLLVTRWLSQRAGSEGTTAKLVAREWRYGHPTRRRG